MSFNKHGHPLHDTFNDELVALSGVYRSNVNSLGLKCYTSLCSWATSVTLLFVSSVKLACKLLHMAHFFIAQFEKTKQIIMTNYILI